MGYLEPIGGYVRLVAPDVAIHGCPFGRTTIPIGTTCVAIKLDQPGSPILVTNPTIYCSETEKMLKTLSPDSSPNVRYIAALNQQHYFGLKSWVEKFPEALVIGVEGLPEKTAKDRIHFDYLYTKEKASSEAVGLPKEIMDAFEMVYYPTGVFHEILLFHKASSTLVTADLLFNLPATDQYKDYWASSSCPSWYSYVYSILQFPMHYLKIDSTLVTWFAQFATRRGTSQANIERVHGWNVQRIIACHGDVVEREKAKAVMTSVFGPLVAKGR